MPEMFDENRLNENRQTVQFRRKRQLSFTESSYKVSLINQKQAVDDLTFVKTQSI